MIAPGSCPRVSAGREGRWATPLCLISTGRPRLGHVDADRLWLRLPAHHPQRLHRSSSVHLLEAYRRKREGTLRGRAVMVPDDQAVLRATPMPSATHRPERSFMSVQRAHRLEQVTGLSGG